MCSNTRRVYLNTEIVSEGENRCFHSRGGVIPKSECVFEKVLALLPRRADSKRTAGER